MNIRTIVKGPAFALPPPVDLLSERWSRVPPRLRMLGIAFLAVLLSLVVTQHVARVQARWGGEPVTVLRAGHDLPVGSVVRELEPVALPAAAVPARAVREVPRGAVLAIALPAGSVLTETHLDPAGPASGLSPDLRAIPIPVEAGWRVQPGGWVDVWALGAGDQPSRLVASSRAVLHVRVDQGRATALVALRSSEVAGATGGLALGTVLLTHAPPPGTRVTSGTPDLAENQ